MHFLRAVAAHPKIGLADSLTKQVYEPSVLMWVNSGLRSMPFMNPDHKKNKTTEELLALETFYREQWRLIENWSEVHHLNFEWVHCEVAKEISFWSRVKERPFDWISRCEPPAFAWEPWGFENEEELPYRKRMRAKFKEALDEYVLRVCHMRKEFLPDRGAQRTHYGWAAERACLNWKWDDIANAHPVPVTWQAVRKAVVPILKRIGIPGNTTQKTKK
jgi:hypothetical protein